MIGLALALALAWGGDALDLSAVRRAEAARDLDTLLAGPFDEPTLPVVARALGRLRDPRALDRLELFASQSDPALREAARVGLATTPGGVAVVRRLITTETDPSARATLWWALGRCGDVSDVPTITPNVVRPWPEGAAAAEAIGVLARRGVDVSAAVPTLVARAGVLDVRVASAVAFALARARPASLDAVSVLRLREAVQRSPSDEVRAWLVPLVLAFDERGRRALRLELLEGHWRLARVAALTDPASWSPEEIERAARVDDPWVQQRLRETFGVVVGVPPAPTPLDVARADLAAGAATARGALLAFARDAELPRDRSTAASVLLGASPTPAELTTLTGATDPVVRELVAEHLGRARDTAALWAMVRTEPDMSTLVAVLRGLRDAPGAPDAAALDRLRTLAADGPFLVRTMAVAVARAAGVELPISPVSPGPTAGFVDVTGVVSARVLTTEGEVRIVLEPEAAPVAVAAFVTLAEQDAFDGLTFHRVVPGFVVQTGDPRGDGMGGPGWFLPDEVDARPFVAGAVGLATSGPDTGGGQWFITTSLQPHLSGDYTRFGLVSRGLDVVSRLDPEDRVLDVIVERVSP